MDHSYPYIAFFDQRAVPFLRNAFYRKANGRRKFR